MTHEPTPIVKDGWILAGGLAQYCWTIDDQLGLAPFFKRADPDLHDPDPNPYERGMDPSGIKALLGSL